MSDTYIGAYWTARRDTLDECATRLSAALSDFANTSPLLAHWFRRGKRVGAPEVPDVSVESITRILGAGQNRRDSDGEPIRELGYSFGLWSGREPAFAVSGTVGLYASNPGLINSFLLQLPGADEIGGALYAPEASRALFASVVNNWDPDWATWSTTEWRRAQGIVHREPVVGWMTYLRGSVPSPAGASAWKVGAGTVVQFDAHITDLTSADMTLMRDRLLRPRGAD